MFDTSRDNARPPMQWNNGEFAGFSEVKPWFNVNKNKDEINIEAALKDENSIYHYYKKLIEIRKNYPVVKEGKYTLHDKFNKWVYVYSRESNDSSLMVICNFKNKEVKNPRYKKLDGYELILSNYQDSKEETLRPYEARVYVKGK
jgi:glycosidase